MNHNEKVEHFFSQYSDEVFLHALHLRKLLLSLLPDVTEQIDLPARIVGYGYGNKYAETICVIIPSKKGLKLGFYKGNELPDPTGLLEGTGKISRYVEIRSEEQIKSAPLKKLILAALKAYRERMSAKK
jgi:hypothetical protein